MFPLRLHVGGERREAQQPHVTGGPGAGGDPAVPGEGPRRPQGALTPGETASLELTAERLRTWENNGLTHLKKSSNSLNKKG